MYCYAITRRDLSWVQQSVQCGHACLEAGRQGLIPDSFDHPHLILCTCADQISLQSLEARLRAAGIRLVAFHEPDLSGELTALCTGPVNGARRRLFAALPLLKSADPPRPPTCPSVGRAAKEVP